MWPFKKKETIKNKTGNDSIKADPVQNNNQVSDIARNEIPAEIIDADQKVWASPQYVERIHRKYYSRYPEKPFISRDREKNTNWEEMAQLFPDKILPKDRMKRFRDGLLPGHVYMLYWIHKVHRKRVPVYFEYEYGIQFEKEKQFLIQKGCLTVDGELTQQGLEAIMMHPDVILEKTPNADLATL